MMSKRSSKQAQITEITVREAGRLGGLANLRAHGRAHYVAIGQKGQRAMRARYPDKAREWGKLGGRPRKPSLDEIMGQGSR